VLQTGVVKAAPVFFCARRDADERQLRLGGEARESAGLVTFPRHMGKIDQIA
jgi:hypothetical protein